MATAPDHNPRLNAEMTLAERVPPQDLDAEMALLGSMMMSREAISETLSIIHKTESHWFYLPAHQQLYEVLIDIYDDPTKAIDLIVVSDELRRRNLLDQVGGQEYMIQLAESFAEWANAEYYAKIVRDKGMLRDLIRCTQRVSESAYSEVDDAREILDRAEQQIFEVTERRVSGETESIRAAVNRLAKQLESEEDVGLTGVPTGFPMLDDYTSGFQYGDLVIIAARPSMGKTALGLNMCAHLALVERKPAVFFSMEMSSDQVAQRLVSALAEVESQKIRRRMLSEEERYRLFNACHNFHDAQLFIDDTPGMTPMELRAKARRLKQKHDIQAVFVDYLQLMHAPGSESRQAEVSNISRNLKALGREIKVPIVAMAQLNRMAEGRQDKRPIMSDLRESGAIEQDADVILLLHREEYYKPEDIDAQGKAELIIAKQRNGPVGNIDLTFIKKLTMFRPRALVDESQYVPTPGDTPF
ncbi:MAG: replicative DNA helicase [Planctomycetota bacterium]|jgi:replicative DNA helicase